MPLKYILSLNFLYTSCCLISYVDSFIFIRVLDVCLFVISMINAIDEFPCLIVLSLILPIDNWLVFIKPV